METPNKNITSTAIFIEKIRLNIGIIPFLN